MWQEKYILKVGQEDLKRMALLGSIYAPYNYTFIKKQGLADHMIVADIACGPGNMTIWFAQQLRQGKVYGIDQSREQLDILKMKIAEQGLSNIVPKIMNIYHLEELEQQLDVIFCRFIFVHLQHPLEALQKLYQLLKPGGKLIVCELDNATWTVYPFNKTFDRFNASLLRYSELNHLDFRIGLKLYHLLREANFEDCKVEIAQPVLTLEQREYFNIRHDILSTSFIEKGLLTKQEADLMKIELVNFVKDQENLILGANMFQVCGTKTECTV